MDIPLSPYIVNHVFLPFRLPKGSDLTEGEYYEEFDLANWVYSAAKEYLALIPPEESAVRSRWQSLVVMLQRLVELNQPGSFIADTLSVSLLGLKDGETLAFLIRQQNAGVVLRLTGGRVVVEAFQVSLPNADVLACHGKILRNFPDACISFNAQFLKQAEFSTQLASVLAQLNVDEMEESVAHASKAGNTLVEPREPSSSHLVTDWLLTTLTAVDGRTELSPCSIQKRIADDVLWDDEYLPWRRSALWLVIRVALQASIEAKEYKNFMLFFATTLMKHATAGDFTDEILATMRTKVGKRAVKLNDSHGLRPFVLDLVNSTQVLAKNKIASSSAKFRALADSNPLPIPWNPSSLRFTRDARLRLANAMPFISTVFHDFENKGSQISSLIHNPRHRPRLGGNSELDQIFKQINHQKLFFEDDDIFLDLATFESVVFHSIDIWTNKHLKNQEAPKLLLEVISRYHSCSSKYYKGDPEGMSTMILTILELWISLDKIVVHQLPLLSRYNPEMPPRLLEPLLLRKGQHIHRALLATQYLHKRVQQSSFSIFAPPSSEAFPIRYFAGCAKMQAQQRQIEAKAKIQADAKRKEIQQKLAEHQGLLARAEAITHNHSQKTVNNVLVEVRKNCERCKLSKKAKKLKVAVFEWPLPRDRIQMENVIFECLIPESFASWRTSTFMILRDFFLRETNIPPGPQVYSHLTSYAPSISLKCPSTPRLTLASITKSFSKTHYNKRQCTAPESQLLVPHGLTWRLQDKTNKHLVSLDMLRNADTFFLCTLQLPSDSIYKALGFSLPRAAHTVNEVLTNQVHCSRNLSLPEFIDFGSLRSGAGLQWLNLAAALSSFSLSFNRSSVYVLISQLVQQLGVVSPSGSAESHTILTSEIFCERLLGSLEKYHEAIQHNWQEVTSLRCLVEIALRLLAGQKHLQSRTLRFLRTCRATLYGWLCNRLHQSSIRHDIAHKEGQNLRLNDLALACHQTYDIDQENIALLLSSSHDVSEFLHCLVVLHTTRFHGHAQSGELGQVDATREKRLLCNIEKPLRTLIKKDPSGLRETLQEILPEFSQNSYSWISTMDSPNERWFHARSGEPNSPSVHLNILSGELLVGGKSLGVLPDSFILHPTYQQLFGKRVFQVLPSNIPGMEYRTQYALHGAYVSRFQPEIVLSRELTNAQIYFRLMTSGRLAIQMLPFHSGITKLSNLSEYIPRDIFEKDLPMVLVMKHLYWLNFSRREIEARPVGAAWQVDRRNWRIFIAKRKRMEQQGRGSDIVRLIEKDSLTFKMLYQMVAPIETAANVFMTYEPGGGGSRLTLHLPRYHLVFVLNKSWGSLESQDFPGTVIDINRNIGTLCGLQSKLVLRRKVSQDQDASPRLRSVIVPRGNMTLKRDTSTGYPLITIQCPSEHQRVSYHVYHIDTGLGCLVSTDSSLVAQLYKAYLHAITSQLHQDELTGQTGLEESIADLSSPACLSFQRLDSSEKAILADIRQLTPKREYYPPGLKKMQKVRWNNDLPSFIQIAFFEHRVFQILNYDAELAVFETMGDRDSKELLTAVEYSGSPSLLTRSTHRELLLPTENALAEDSPQPTDVSWDPPQGGSKKWSRFCETLSTVWQLSPRKLRKRKLSLHNLVLDMASKPAPILTVFDIPLDILSYARNWFSLNEENFQERWFNLVRGCTLEASADSKRFRLLFSFSAWLYTQSRVARSYIPELILIARDSDVYRPLVQILCTKTCSLSIEGAVPSPERVLGVIHSWAQNHEHSGTAGVQDLDLHHLSQAFFDQWQHFPEVTVQAPQDIDERLIPTLLRDVDSLFTSCYRVGQFHSILQRLDASCSSMPTITQHNQKNLRSSLHAMSLKSPLYKTRSVLALHQNSHPPVLASYYIPDRPTDSSIPIRGSWDSASRQSLLEIISRLSNTKGTLQGHYATDIASSLRNLDDQLQADLTSPPLPTNDLTAAEEIRKCLRIVKEAWDCISAVLLAPQTPSDALRVGAGLWPRIHLRNVLRMMTPPFWPQLSLEWKTLLIELCFRILLLQHARRVYSLVKRNRTEDLMQELQFGWPSISKAVALEHPDWMLIQVESNFAARPVQLKMAQEMFEPTSGQNLALQLNMGEGKTSVIVPFVASALADGRKLTRVIVLKPLVQQTFHLLRTRLCGLPNKTIAFFPFSRNMLRTSENDLRSISLLFHKAASDCAIVVAQPEHVLSSKLLTVERLLFSTREASLQAAGLHEYLKTNARDVLDENDELLHVRYQLIYTLGNQDPIEGHPYRWTILQELLDTVLASLRCTSHEYLVLRPSQQAWIFPHFHVNGHLASLTEALRKIVARSLMGNSFATLNVAHLSEASRKLICDFVLDPNPSEAAISVFHAQTLISQGSILTLRGYLSSNILAYGLCERRWRVDYGLDSSRETQMAVPFRSKDVPSPRAEFGHPDLAILLTCLAYYYQGLTEEQLRHCLNRLLTMSDAAEQYNEWTAPIPHRILPSSIRQVTGINLEDSEQFSSEVFPLFRQNFITINSYLNGFIFPKYAKSFPHKLSTSGWDLAEQRNHPITGFSGTKDNHYLLPLSMSQLDPVGQAGTNALVLMYMLGPDNNRYFPIGHDSLGAKGIIDTVVRQRDNTHVILDVGAQILDLSNRETAQYWLEHPQGMTRVEAVVYFNDNDELSVIRRDGTEELFRSSTYREQTGKCVFYLDDAHTRGTDLRFPNNWRAAVTLGKKVTKDRLIQGCMRMRQLGAGQSLMFLAPPDIDFAIRHICSKSQNDSVGVQDIILWAMHETCNDIEHHAPAWAQQGQDYMNRRKALDDLPASLVSQDDSLSIVRSAWLQQETKGLRELYLPDSPSRSVSSSAVQDATIQSRLQKLGIVATLPSRDLHEEQEREVAHEVEAEPEVERPKPTSPNPPQLHHNLVHFAQTGVLKTESAAFCTIDAYLQRHFGSRWRRLAKGAAFSGNFFTTCDFLHTLLETEQQAASPVDFIKPVRWVLSSKRKTQLVVISQHEANALLPHLQQSTVVQMHQYLPVVTTHKPLAKHFQFFNIPDGGENVAADTGLMAQLNVFAGELYPQSYSEYVYVCEFLGIDLQQQLETQSDGFVLPQDRRGRLSACPFQTSPLDFFKELFSLRRKGQLFDKSPIGKLLNGRILGKDDFEG